MTINEFIERLKQFNGDMQVVQTRFDGRGYYYESFDGWFPQMAVVEPSSIEGRYRESDDGIDVLTI